MSSTVWRCLAACSLLLSVPAAIAAGQGSKVLVVLENTALKSTHSSYFSALSSRGYQLTYAAADGPDLKIKDWDTYLYEKIIVFASSTSGLPVQHAWFEMLIVEVHFAAL